MRIKLTAAQKYKVLAKVILDGPMLVAGLEKLKEIGGRKDGPRVSDIEEIFTAIVNAHPGKPTVSHKRVRNSRS